MRKLSRCAAILIVLATGSRVASAERDIVIETPGERATGTKLLLGGLTAVAGIAGGLGLAWHLDSRDAADEVSATKFTGDAWTPADAALVERADRSRTRAVVGYSVGGAFLIAAVVALIVTEPPTEITVIRPGAAPTVSPTEGGALLGSRWSF